jgi:hypothetical protein
VPRKLRGGGRTDKAPAPKVESYDAQRAAREAESQAVHAAMQRNPRSALFSLAHILAGAKEPGCVEGARILYAVALALERREIKALRGKGGPLGWAKRYLERLPHPIPPSQIAFVRDLEGFVRDRMHLDADGLAFYAVGRLLVWAELAGLGWHTHTPHDVDGLTRRIASEIRKAWERTPVTIDRTVQAILVGWGLTRADAERVCKKA